MTISKAIPGLALGGVLLSACSLGATNHDIEQGRAIQATCDGPVADLIAVDVSPSFARSGVEGDFEKVLRDGASRVLICGGRLRVDAFSGTTAGVDVLIDRELSLPGATENARFRRAPGEVDDIVEEVEGRYLEAAAHATRGSDPVNQFTLASQFARQIGPDYNIEATIVSDGWQTEEVQQADIMHPARAARAVRGLRIASLDGVKLTIAGIGDIEGAPPSARAVDGMIAFYTEACRVSGAESCTVVASYVAKTDW